MAVTVPITRPSCMRSDPSFRIRPIVQTNRMPPMTLVRRWRQKVSGVVTPFAGRAGDRERQDAFARPCPARPWRAR